jgi:hypothetical protein
MICWNKRLDKKRQKDEQKAEIPPQALGWRPRSTALSLRIE